MLQENDLQTCLLWQSLAGGGTVGAVVDGVVVEMLVGVASAYGHQPVSADGIGIAGLVDHNRRCFAGDELAVEECSSQLRKSSELEILPFFG